MVSEPRLAAYTGERPDLLRLVPSLCPDSLVIDVGCSTGSFGVALKKAHEARVIGIELDRELADEARRRLDNVVVGDALAALCNLRADGLRADLVIFGDVLEHLVDPWSVVDAAADLMSEGGWILASIPNVAHYHTIVQLLRGTWPMRERGLHDSTHLRFFARRDLQGLLGRGRCSISAIHRTYRLIERPHRMNKAARGIGWVWPNLFTYQFLVLVRVAPSAGEDLLVP